MIVTFEELRKTKHQLPTGSVKLIAKKLKVSEQTIRNYFGANKFEEGTTVGKHVRPGPNGGFVDLENEQIYIEAKAIIKKAKAAVFA